MEVNGFTDFERVKSEMTFLWQSDDGPCCPFLYPLAKVTCLCSIVNLTTVQCFSCKDKVFKPPHSAVQPAKQQQA